TGQTAAGGAANTAADAAITAAAGAVAPITNAARDARIATRAADEASVGTFRARFPGADGNMEIRITTHRGQNVLSLDNGTPRVRQVRNQDLVWLSNPQGFFIAERANNSWQFTSEGAPVALATLSQVGDSVQIATLTVEVLTPGTFAQPQTWDDLTVHLDRRRDGILNIFAEEITNRTRMLETPLVLERTSDAVTPVALANALIGAGGLADLADASTTQVSNLYVLRGGNDGVRPGAEEYRGQGGEDVQTKSGLNSFEDLEDISIVAAPGVSFGAADAAYASVYAAATQHVISHCERMRYRVAVLDSPNDQAISQVRTDRAVLDSTHAAYYYPWVQVQDPVTREPIYVPPSGFLAGIYARSDNQIGVHKAPANEPVRGAIGLQTLINKAQQDVLNPLGINCLRFFEGRGVTVWGARTVSSDPEWKYLNIRRYFAYLEASIDRSTQWAVFSPNGEALWANIRRSVENFLENEWREGRLAGASTDAAYFVRCDRSTMTQNDLDNGRMICLIGVAPLYPAEFVIFRIGQWTADRP
ncbi:MAG: phage tail sheath family protein, partial [Dehalococcoidia bacterium]